MSRAARGAGRRTVLLVTTSETPDTGYLPVMLNPFEPGYFDDPYSQYRRVRERDPVHLSPNRTWILTRYDHIEALNHDRRLGRDLRPWPPYRTFRPYMADSALERSVERWMINLDPPDHTRLRRSAARFFTAGAMAQLADPIASITDGLLDELDGADEFEFIDSFVRQGNDEIGFTVDLIDDLLCRFHGGKHLDSAEVIRVRHMK